MNVSIILPCFNSEKFISNSYIRLKKKIKELNLKPEIIFIDDGSEDKTYQSLKILKKKNKRIKIFKNKFNMGKSFSLIKAIKKMYMIVFGSASIAFYSNNKSILTLATNTGSIYTTVDYKNEIMKIVLICMRAHFNAYKRPSYWQK